MQNGVEKNIAGWQEGIETSPILTPDEYSGYLYGSFCLPDSPTADPFYAVYSSLAEPGEDIAETYGALSVVITDTNISYALQSVNQ